MHKSAYEAKEKLIRLETRSKEQSTRKSTFWSEEKFARTLKDWIILSIEDFEGWSIWRWGQKLKTLDQFFVLWRNVTIRLWVIHFVIFWPC